MDPGRINESDVGRVEMLFDVLLVVIPHIAELVLSNSPLSPGAPASKPIVTVPTLSGAQQEETEEGFGNEFGIADKYKVLDEKQREHIFNEFEKYLQTKISEPRDTWMWKELKWLDGFIGSLVKIICNSRSLEASRVSILFSFWGKT